MIISLMIKLKYAFYSIMHLGIYWNMIQFKQNQFLTQKYWNREESIREI